MDLSIELYNGDCLEVIKNIPSNSVDLIITDPPYKKNKGYHDGGGGFGAKKRGHHTELGDHNLLNGISNEMLLEMLRVMKKVNIYIWCNKFQLLQYMLFFKSCSFDLLTWHKSNPIPICNNKYLSDTEYLLFFREQGVNVYGTYQSKKKWYVTSTNTVDKNKYKHPTIKPLNIIENLMVNSSVEGDIVLDPFMGSGTTGVACKELNRDFIGIEIDKNYFLVAQDRIQRCGND